MPPKKGIVGKLIELEKKEHLCEAIREKAREYT